MTRLDDGLSSLDDISDQMTVRVNIGHIRRNSGGAQGWAVVVKKLGKAPRWLRSLRSVRSGATRRKRNGR